MPRSANESRVKILPTPNGPFSVGCADLMTRGTPETGVFFRLFYPTAKCDISKKVAELPLAVPQPEYWEGLASMSGFMGKTVKWYLNKVTKDYRVPARWHAPLAPVEESSLNLGFESGFPLLVFAHGYAGSRVMYSVICSHMASHGFIVASMESRNGVAGYSYYFQHRDAGGKSVKIVPSVKLSPKPISPGASQELVDQHWPQINKQVKECSEECIRAMQLMAAINKGSADMKLDVGEEFNLAQFKDRINLDKTAIAGQSFGGGTAIMAASALADFKVCLAIDALVLSLDRTPFPIVQQPILMLLSDVKLKPQTGEPEILHKIIGEQGQVVREAILLKGSKHLGQSDFLFYMNDFITKQMAATIDHNLCNEIQNNLLLAFLQKHLNIPSDTPWEYFLMKYRVNLSKGLPEKLQYQPKSGM